MIFVFGSLLCISLATDAVCASSACSMNETLPVLSVSVIMTSRDNDNDSRSLLDIVYSRPAAVFACVWAAAHPNIHHVPDRTQGYIRRKLCKYLDLPADSKHSQTSCIWDKNIFVFNFHSGPFDSSTYDMPINWPQNASEYHIGLPT
ncbi:hypothetical protein FIBSPDRAFT_882107 [Athelia psychrophila]|uniref:Uncharacterized protein n=1 Tax=Athelia psychrophila TaxID=1759441 RepID=A0A166VI32_9AGAM|nr:hypothetical protein FIBSPDRAFT_882107 [Fibularhizoctonia sp. CBS 109695]